MVINQTPLNLTTTTISTILEEFRQDAISNRDLGDKFERLMVTYLKIDPLYKDLYSNVWMWMDFPKRGNAPDTGIDLVAEERATGDYCAIQCKFYDPNHTLDKSDIDSFFTASGKALFKKRMIVGSSRDPCFIVPLRPKSLPCIHGRCTNF